MAYGYLKNDYKKFVIEDNEGNFDGTLKPLNTFKFRWDALKILELNLWHPKEPKKGEECVIDDKDELKNDETLTIPKKHEICLSNSNPSDFEVP